LDWALGNLIKTAKFPPHFNRAYWTPPLTPEMAYDLERGQVEERLGLRGMVSLTDHDSIEAPMILQSQAAERPTPVSLEWSVPYGETVFHLGIHNLPVERARDIMATLAAHTKNPERVPLADLMESLAAMPDVLIVFNHPLWDFNGLGEDRFGPVLNKFLEQNIRFLHGFELNAIRTWKENGAVLRLADRWRRPLISGGDRHGATANGALNLTRAETFSEFVHEIREDQRSHVLFMPLYSKPYGFRMMQEVLDIIRYYPDHPLGSRRWDERVYHPDQTMTTDRPLSALWKAPPRQIERVFKLLRLWECTRVKKTVATVFTREVDLRLPREIPSGAAFS
jgi:hypothetical protein